MKKFILIVLFLSLVITFFYQKKSQQQNTDSNFKCEKSDFNCISKSLEQVTKTSGPKAAIEVLGNLQKMDKVDRGVDEHQLAHMIGRQTAAVYGTNAKAFMLCPMADYNGGCQHGFFEHVLGKTATAKEAAETICESIKDGYSSKDYFYCYHGVGHGVMMAQAYDLKGSLDICDSLSSKTGTDGCWQGVFMENVVVGMKGEAREGIFSEKDPLAPCSEVEEKYKYQCYINHAGYLMVISKNSFPKAADGCKQAEEHTSTCIQSLGGLTTNSSWQVSVTGKNDKADEVNLALNLCNEFPEELQRDCFTGALDNILNNDGMNLEKRALKYCSGATLDKGECIKQIGINIARQVIDREEREKLCNQVDKAYIKDCKVSAGV